MKTDGQVVEAEGSWPIRGEADVKPCCLDIRESRGEQRLVMQICRTPCFIISAAHRARVVSPERNFDLFFFTPRVSLVDFNVLSIYLFIHLFIYLLNSQLWLISVFLMLLIAEKTSDCGIYHVSPDFSLLFLCLFIYQRRNNGCTHKRENDC